MNSQAIGDSLDANLNSDVMVGEGRPSTRFSRGPKKKHVDHQSKSGDDEKGGECGDRQSDIRRDVVLPCESYRVAIVFAMIRSFGNDFARAAWNRHAEKGIPTDVLRIAHRKLMQIHNARSLDDLRSPPGNRLEALKGDRRGQHSVRVNDRWRVCFRWSDGNADNVEVCDYHG